MASFNGYVIIILLQLFGNQINLNFFSVAFFDAQLDSISKL